MSRPILRLARSVEPVYAENIDRAAGPALLFIVFGNGEYRFGIKAAEARYISETGSTNIAVAYRALLFAKRALVTSVPAPVSDGLVNRCTQAATLLGTSVHLAKDALGPTFWYIGWDVITHVRDLRLRDMPRRIRAIAAQR